MQLRRRAELVQPRRRLPVGEVEVDALLEREVVPDRDRADVVVGVAHHVHEAERDADERANPLEEVRVVGERVGHRAAALVADHAQGLEASLPLAGNRVRVVGPVSAHVEPVRTREDAGEELVSRAAADDERRGVELVGDNGVTVRVQQGADDAVSAARIADEQEEALHRGELLPVAAARPRAPDVSGAGGRRRPSGGRGCSPLDAPRRAIAVCARPGRGSDADQSAKTFGRR